ncbi:divalent-cation tolerance protein CutA [Variovorax terrae]|uniref:Divalent-cation tolerance protein CutA n=1 Tax=Variovorax terrae TaxID=2923278 RepID=A0A9X2ALB5_9BURK|nr:divalent-cation tolerance protein CutA [Variovorax terrae]MCJ0762139.1 divalent-cation tolerance protein CutA [Variovorax terrae]
MQDSQKYDIWSVATTVATLEDAHRLAREVLAQQLAACAQIEPIESLYPWQGRLCEEREFRLTFKTAPAARTALERWLKAHHPYELPQIVAMKYIADKDYAAWTLAQLGPQSGA